MAAVEEYHLAVVGAGFNGLMAAKVYLELNPSATVIICESNDSLGGVWALDRLYPHLHTNNMFGTYEYPDFPTQDLVLGVRPGQYMPGRAVNQYLTHFASKYCLDRLIRFRTSVETAETLGPDGWLLTLSGSDGGSTRIKVRKLIMATGVTSEARIPHYPGQDSFRGLLFHGKDLARVDPVAAGIKDFASAGAKVHWVIRKSGHGPAWMGPSFVTPFKIFQENLVVARFMTWLSPYIWASNTGLEGLMRSFFHRTWLGRKIVDAFFSLIAEELIDFGGFHRSAETKKLIPWVSPFWVGAGRGIIKSYEHNFTDLIASGRVDVHIGELSHLSDRSVFLTNGTELPADAIASCTGWKHKPTTRFLPTHIEAQLGLHSAKRKEPPGLESRLDAQILTSFPRLVNQPSLPECRIESEKSKSADDGQFQLYRFIAPPAPFIHDHNLAFCGYVQSFATPILATVQSLWIAAYFADALPHITRANDTTTAYDTLLHARFGRWRYPWCLAARFPDFVFDAIPYIDLLLRDLELQSDRHRPPPAEAGCWLNWLTFGLYARAAHALRNACWPYRRADYAGLVDEWVALRGASAQAASPAS